jgi:hypothetical protein
MLPLFVYQAANRLHPRLVSGARLHRRALDVSASGSPAEAERWFEAAATAYRDELAIEALARLRVHQLMVRVRARPASSAATSEMLEIVRRLNRLDHLERLEPPFELCDARSVLAEWIERSDRRAGPPERHAATLQAA